MSNCGTQTRRSAQLALWILVADLVGCKPLRTHSVPLDNVVEGASGGPSAYETWLSLRQAAAELKGGVLHARGNERRYTFGWEKEGSSSVIMQIAGPSAADFRAAANDQGEAFVRQFMTSWASGAYRLEAVRDLKGRSRGRGLNRFAGKDYGAMSSEDLAVAFDGWLNATEDRPFAFVKPQIRQKIFRGSLSDGKVLFGGSTDFLPHFGDAEAYVDKVEYRNDNWEIISKPMLSYAELEASIAWVRVALKKGDHLFDHPGHVRLSMPNPRFGAQRTADYLEHLREVVRVGQAYIIMREILGKTGLSSQTLKTPADEDAISNWDAGKGVLSLEEDEFVKDSLSVEQRSGNKSDYTRRNFQGWLLAYAASADFGTIARLSDYNLSTDFVPKGLEWTTRFGVSPEVGQRALAKLTKRPYRGRFPPPGQVIVQEAFLVPLWKWENAPFTQGKRALLKELSSNFIVQLAAIETPTAESIDRVLGDWIRATNLLQDIEAYLTPTPALGDVRTSRFEQRDRSTDVNSIDLGIEYTAQFPVRNVSEFVAVDGEPEWVATMVDLTVSERRSALESLARELCGRLGGSLETVRIVPTAPSDHGHGIGLSFQFQDSLTRQWRVEWDGIGRSYDPDGSVIAGSERGGHIEVVTPKLSLTDTEINIIFESMRAQGLAPMHRSGGGHINIDLAPFAGKPQALARFLALFNQYRGIASFLFQHVSRLRSAEPVEISETFGRTLAHFQGTELELKQLLYNETWFNSRLNRKTKYVQLALEAYFQDVIPSQFISRDFDIKNPATPWRRTFEVDPNVRKMELRFFDAPENPWEAALQIKFVRALLNRALNSSESLSGDVQAVDHFAFASDLTAANTALERMCRDLNLEATAYRGFLYEAIFETKRTGDLPGFQLPEARLEKHPKTEGWSSALKVERTRPIASEERSWEEARRAGSGMDPAVEEAVSERIERAERAKAVRESIIPGKPCERLLRQGIEATR